MKKIVSIILSVMILMTPVLSMAATLNIGCKLSGFALQETVALGSEYTVAVPKDMYMIENSAAEGMELLYYITETAEKQFLIAAMPEKAEMNSMSRTVGKNHKSLLSTSSSAQVRLPEELAETVGENAVMFRDQEENAVVYQLVFATKDGYRFTLISAGSLEMEGELLSMICALRKK